MPESRNINKTSDETKKNGLNIWIVISAIILIYLIVSFCSYFFSNETALYEVVAGTSESLFNTGYTALIIREEKAVYSDTSGYINFLVGDSTPIYVEEPIYVIDSDGSLSSRLEEAALSQSVLTDNDLKSIKNTIYDFDTSFSTDDFYEAYYFKYMIESQIMDFINNNVFEEIGESGDVLENTYNIEKAEISGIIQHNIDGFEDVSLDDVEASMFRRSNYNKSIIKSNDYINSGEAVYKVIQSENWSLVIQLDSDTDFSEVDYVTVEFLSDGITTDAEFETFTRAGIKYGVINLSKYMIRYASDRYEQIRIIYESEEGLKIPKSSVNEEYFYTIPVSFMIQGGNSSDYGFLKSSGNGESAEFISPDIIKVTDEYCYVSVDDIEKNTILIQTETNDQFKVNSREKLTVAYISDGSFFTAKPVEILGEANGFYIIADNTKNGLRLYDQIRKVAEND